MTVSSRLLGFTCKKCGKMMFPRRPVCPACKGRDIGELELGDQEALLVTFTRLWAVPEGIQVLPLTLGIVEFQNGIRMTAPMVGEDVTIGSKVRPVWGCIRKVDGKEVFGFKFQLERGA